MVVDKPDLTHSRPNVDFGKGFYTTPIYEQAENGVNGSRDVAKMAS